MWSPVAWMPMETPAAVANSHRSRRTFFRANSTMARVRGSQMAVFPTLVWCIWMTRKLPKAKVRPPITEATLPRLRVCR